MKYSSKMYAAALLEVLKDGFEERSVKQFLMMVRRNGAFSKLPYIVREFGKAYNRANDLKDVHVVVARESQKTIHSIKEAMNLKHDPSVSIDKEILGGAIVTIDEETVVDGSVRTRINKLFR